MSSIGDPVDPRTLRALVAVADEGSVRGAARALGYTQSAISHQVALLEQRLGTQLFIRPGGRRRMTLTPLGELAYEHAHRVLTAGQALEGDMRAALAGERGSLRIGTSQSTSFLLADTLAKLRRDRPGVEVFLTNAGTAETLAQQLHQGQLDVGVYINVEPDERVVTIPLFQDVWVILAHPRHRLAGSSSIALEALDGVDMIAWPQRWRAQGNLEQLWRRRRVKPRIVYRTDDNLMIQSLVASGLGCACMGAISVQRLVDARLARILIRDELPLRTLSVCYSRQREPTPAAVALIDAIRTAPAPSFATAVTEDPAPA